MSGLLILKPLAVTDVTLVSSNVPENDAPVYAAGTTYAAKALVMYKHSVYESAADNNVGNTPDLKPDKWVRVRATNRWRLFDGTNSSRTEQATTISYVFAPEVPITMVAALNLAKCTSARVRLVDPSLPVESQTYYDVTQSPGPRPIKADWWEWFFGIWSPGLSYCLFQGLPVRPGAYVMVDLVGGTGLAIGMLMYGQPRSWGMGVLQGARVGRRSYSRREVNDFGDFSLVRRPSAKQGSFETLLDVNEVDAVQDYLDAIDASVCLFVGSSKRNATVIYGVYQNNEVLLKHARYSILQIDILGVT